MNSSPTATTTTTTNSKREEEEKKAEEQRQQHQQQKDDDSDDYDEFSDVVVLDPLGVEEETSSEEERKSQKFDKISNQQQQQQEVPTVQQTTITTKHLQMDPPVQYPNLSKSAGPQFSPNSAANSQQQQQQSWFSSAHLPSFLSNNKDAFGSDQGDGQSQPASASLLGLLGQLRARLQPWGEFFRPAKFGLPPGLIAVGPRVKNNLQHFLSNYLCLFIVLLIYCILTSFLMLLTLIVLAGLCYTVYQRTQKGPIVLGGQEVPPSLLYTLALMVCIPLFYLANAGTVMYWVIGTGLFLIMAHAIFYASEGVPGQEFEVVTVVTT